jgi:3-oxoacyl-[acyl-carrier-protein] synthase II
MKFSLERAAAITGVGVVSPFGWGISAFLRGLEAQKTAIQAIQRFDTSGYRTMRAAEVPDPLPFDHAKRLTRADCYALHAAGEAIAFSGLEKSLSSLSVGVFLGSSTGGMWESESYFEELLQRRTRRISRLVSQPPSGPAEALARAWRVTGPVMTVVTACASATLAFGLALEALRAGEIDVALAGGSDSFCRLTFAGFNSLRAVDPEACRPFRKERAGMSLGEGAAVLVLEPVPNAQARAAQIFGYLLGTGASCDAFHMTSPDADGAGIERAVRAALADAEVKAEHLDFVNVHGTGTLSNDLAESRMLRRVFGARAVPITSTKSFIGHYLGAAGAVEAVATLVGLETGLVHPTLGSGCVDPDLEVDLVTETPRRVDAELALSTNLAFGGANGAAVFARGTASWTQVFR